jgi:hypothetical protein
VAHPLYQLRHRDQLVLPSALDRVSRELLIRAQIAIDSAINSVADDAVDSPDIVTESTLRWHEWRIAIALRDITDLRAEHEYNTTASAGPMTDSVLEPQQRALRLATDAIESRVTRLSVTQPRYSRQALRCATGKTHSGYRTSTTGTSTSSPRPPPMSTPSPKSAA